MKIPAVRTLTATAIALTIGASSFAPAFASETTAPTEVAQETDAFGVAAPAEAEEAPVEFVDEEPVFDETPAEVVFEAEGGPDPEPEPHGEITPGVIDERGPYVPTPYVSDVQYYEDGTPVPPADIPDPVEEAPAEEPAALTATAGAVTVQQAPVTAAAEAPADRIGAVPLPTYVANGDGGSYALFPESYTTGNGNTTYTSNEMVNGQEIMLITTPTAMEWQGPAGEVLVTGSILDLGGVNWTVVSADSFGLTLAAPAGVTPFSGSELAAPTPETPVEEAPAPEAPAPSPEAPVEEAPAPEAPEAPAPEAPVKEVPAAETPAAPAPEAPAEETPAPATDFTDDGSMDGPDPVGEAPTGFAPEWPVENAPAEDLGDYIVENADPQVKEIPVGAADTGVGTEVLADTGASMEALGLSAGLGALGLMGFAARRKMTA